MGRKSQAARKAVITARLASIIQNKPNTAGIQANMVKGTRGVIENTGPQEK
jgi:hypothetical protein